MKEFENFDVVAYTDGACSGNPGPGGWGAVLQHWRGGLNKQRELCAGEPDTTNNRMELMAVIEALRALTRPSKVLLFTDSQYVCKGFAEWLPGWVRKGWRTKGNQPVKNQDLWLALLQAAQPHQITWRWVKGHNGDVGNERADELARAGIAKLKQT